MSVILELLSVLITWWPSVKESTVSAEFPTRRENQRGVRSAARRGLSLIEMMVALAISAMLLTATAVAIDTSFTAYGIAAESASTQTSTRMVSNRLLTLIRTSTAHDPLLLADAEAGETVTLSGNVITSSYLVVTEPDGDFIRISWDSANQELLLTRNPGMTDEVTQPILGGVTACEFQLNRRRDNNGLWVLERGSIDFTVQPDDDSSLDIEVADVPPVRVVASTKPRRVD